jgi:hypothetical protein
MNKYAMKMQVLITDREALITLRDAMLEENAARRQTGHSSACVEASFNEIVDALHDISSRMADLIKEAETAESASGQDVSLREAFSTEMMAKSRERVLEILREADEAAEKILRGIREEAANIREETA